MLTLEKITDWLESLGLSDNVYMGKLDNKKPKSIGIYPRDSTGEPRTALGGLSNTKYDVRPMSLLIHWNNSARETEAAANNVFEQLRTISNITIEDTKINFIRMRVPEPQGVGTDDNGVYEYVIWFDFIYER